jgi:hypothetical protein
VWGQQKNRIRKGEMNKFVKRVISFCLLFGALTFVAWAKSGRKQVTFLEPVKVNDILIKAGTYDATFDEESGQLIIFKGSRAIAKAPARLEKTEKNSRTVYVLADGEKGAGEPKVLTSITLRDGTRAKLVNPGDNRAEGSQ